MTAAERKLIAIQVADEIMKRTDKVLNDEALRSFFNVKTNGALRHKKDAGFPIRKKKGMGYYAFESEIMKFLKL